MSEAKKSKILAASRSVFLRYGYKRVTMNDIAAAAGLSRAAVYLSFKNKEDVFVGVFRQWVDETLAEIERETAKLAKPREKIRSAFELWTVRPFELASTSAEARELMECSFEFAQEALQDGYRKFEAAVTALLAARPERRATRAPSDPQRLAHVLASAARGFKQAAATPADLRQLIEDLLTLAVGDC